MAASIEADNADSVSLKQLFDVIWSGKWLIVAVTFVCGLIAFGIASMLPKKYEAEAVVAVASNNSGGAMGALGSVASQLGGLASLAGISLGANEKEAESIAVLQSETLTEMYIRDNNLMPVLYADFWDASRGDWKPMDAARVPTLWKATRYFRSSVRRVKVDNLTGLVNITVTWTDPELAASWANGLVLLANKHLRERAIAESEANIAYLNKEAQQTELVGAKQAIYAILQSEINKSMMARGRAEYAFKVIDAARTPEIRSSPIRLLWLLGGLAFGAFFSVVFVFVRTTWR